MEEEFLIIDKNNIKIINQKENNHYDGKNGLINKKEEFFFTKQGQEKYTLNNNDEAIKIHKAKN